MENLEITIGAKPHIIGLGDHPTGRGHFITWKDSKGRNILADYILSTHSNDVLKLVEANLIRIKLDTDELKPLPEQYAEMAEDAEPGTAVCLVDERFVEDFTNTSKNSKETGERYSYYYQSATIGNSGSNLYRMALALHVLLHFKVWILDAEGNFIQPVTLEQEPTENDFEVAVSVVDGIEPFIYSKDGETWNGSNILTYNENERENARIFVLDSAGTIGTALANFTNRNADSGS